MKPRPFQSCALQLNIVCQISYIYNSKKDEMAIDLYTFLVKLKTRMVIEEYRYNIYDKHVEIKTMWARLADSV